MSGFPMLLKQQDFYKSLTARHPGLVERVRKLIEESEIKFTGGKIAAGGFLWEHTVLVASLAFRLAKMEKEDADLAAMTALFHDSGKFSGGRYHRDEKPEEEAAARLAREVLEDAELDMAAVGHVVRALRSLYNAGARRNKLADIIHDADFLSKFGLLGVAEFFVKSTLRGRNLETAIMNHLSKELTYAAVLPLNMRTESARKFAARKSGETLRFYRSFLAELKEAHGMDFKVRTPEVRRSLGRPRRLKIMLVAPAVCGSCGRGWELDFRTEKGVKCERLEAAVRCAGCGATHEIAFCLPEIA
ncbi:MAG: HD domain-containing protein [Candidatus Aminicenantales bacterium]|jgi:HD superfamily phosphodiesterase